MGVTFFFLSSVVIGGLSEEVKVEQRSGQDYSMTREKVAFSCHILLSQGRRWVHFKNCLSKIFKENINPQLIRKANEPEFLLTLFRRHYRYRKGQYIHLSILSNLSRDHMVWWERMVFKIIEEKGLCNWWALLQIPSTPHSGFESIG